MTTKEISFLRNKFTMVLLRITWQVLLAKDGLLLGFYIRF